MVGVAAMNGPWAIPNDPRLYAGNWQRLAEDADPFEDADAERYQRETHGPIYEGGEHDGTQ
jgi:hypothetical protein